MTRNLVALFAAVASTAALVSACGGGSSNAIVAPSPPVPTPPPPGTTRGTIVKVATPSTITKATIDAFGSDDTSGPTKPGETASCDVTIRQIQYVTLTPANAAITASAGLMVPTGSGCTGARPLLTMQHGTSDSTFNGASAKAPLPLTMAKYFASHGYVVVIPDYLGYGVAAGTYHPYVNAEANATTVIDAVRATRNWFATSDGQSTGVSMSGQLFLTGTSEGGYITMATHRTMERDFASEFPITADVPTSGPYNLSAEVMANLTIADDPSNSNSGSATFLLTAYQQVYGDIYTVASEVFQTPWDTTVEGLFPGNYGSDVDAMQACQIPFNVHTAPSPVQANCSTGTNPLLQPQYVTDYLSNNVGTAGGTARAHIEANDLLGVPWKNVAPMTICYGDLDTTAMGNAVAAGNFLGIAPVDVQVQGPSYITSWMQTASGGQSSDTYHGQIEAPGCTAYARYSVFDNYVAPL